MIRTPLPRRFIAAFVAAVTCSIPAIQAQIAPAPRPPAIDLLALEGEGVINHVRKRQLRDIVVQVRDGNRRPIAGATVNFTLPMQGPSGEFASGSRTLSVTSDSEGRAMAREFRPNSAEGKIEIRVSATRGAETASLVITQFNMAVSAARGNGKWLTLAGLIGGAAAGGAYYAATQGKNGSTPAAAATPISITPGPGAVGRPQ